MSKSLLEIHEEVPANHYDKSIQNNIFQRYWHTRRFQEVLKVIKPVNGPVLDIGCHGGTFTEKILTKIKSQKIYGIDVSQKAIEFISKRIPYGKFKVADGESLPFKSGFFDTVFCLEVLEHVDSSQKVVMEIKRVLKKGGYGVILIPTTSILFKLIWSLWVLVYPVWKHAHVQNFPKQTLEETLKQQGLKVTYVKFFNSDMLKLVVFKKSF